MKPLFVGLLLFLSSFAISQEENARPEILSIYHGLDPLPPGATRLCGLPPAANQDGMPVVFSVQINADSISPAGLPIKYSFILEPGV